ncbi:interferon-induced, double-stranded RNA-activated protein kinase-like isoform X3 [Limanda limanda]|uniref:interferon-induced, double-stranded RNA-activated protein kinase-like isoform X3 n=1 Tax=Limanda limanda TaxID=27771 RepID=UPI0029C9918A|nr:interferon-induced, double-stranded RNA-activated protein kinase-like isoform X3 [Limanda limanda]
MAAENYVAKLNEYAQGHRSVLRYEEVGSVGPDHIKTFTLRAIVNNKAFPDGVGHNKKEAKQNAAQKALKCLFEESADCTENVTAASISPVQPTSIINNRFVCWLNEYGNGNKVLIRPVESTRLGPNNASYCCSFWVGEKEFPAGYGKTKREAKEEAAKLAHHEICDSKTTETGDEKYGGTSSQQNEESKQDLSEICDKTNSLSVKAEGGNFIGIVNQYCQKTQRSHTYVFEKRCGEAHSPQFFYKLVIDNKEYPVGEGKNVKEARQNAARLAWAALQEQTDYDSKVTESEASLPTLSNSPDAQSKRIQTAKSDSGVFSNSPTPPKDQDQSPKVKPKIRLAANFQNALRHSKEAVTNFNGKTPGNSPCKETPAQSVMSRFTKEYDCIVSIGKGAFGQVFKAREILINKNCAVKIVRCKGKSLREVATLSDLQHCNIVRYYTCWTEDSSHQMDSTSDSSSASQSSSNSSVKYLYIHMELCDTKTLRLWIDEKDTQNVKKSLRDSKRREESKTIAKQIVSGVDYIHSKKFIHRDLKPANILFGQDRQVKIGDFGLVTAENDDDADNLIERTECKGTPSYMAPEQKSGSTYDRKVDIFASGLIYFELLWNLSGERKLIWDDARNQKLPQGFSQNFLQESQIIKSMLSLKPEDRPEAGKLKKDIEECTHTFTTPKNMPNESNTV